MEINSELTSTSEDYSKNNNSDSEHTFKVIRHLPHTTKSSKGNSLQSESNDNILGIHLHKTSGLSFSKHLKHPRIKCSLYDPKTKVLAKKSNNEKNVILNLEPNDLDFILPVISKECKIDAKLEIFSNETIIINESIEYLKTSEFIIFLEIIDMELKVKKEKHKRVFNGWRYFCWAFTAINSKFLEFNKEIILQCYKYKKQVEENSAFNLWSSGYLKKYPASIVISLKALEPKFISIGLTRPSTSLEKDKLDIRDRKTSSLNSDTNSNLPEFDFILKKLNNSTEVTYAETVSSGSTTCSISPNGDFVAYTLYEKRSWSIVIVDLRNFKKIQYLRGHQLTIYKLNWLFSKDESINYLISCSEDKSCIIWRLKENFVIMTHVLPHPYFVYTAKFITNINNKKSLLVITGGFDKVVRIWKISKHDEISSIVQELSGHKTYLVDVFYENINNQIYSVEAYGTIIEWVYDEAKSLWNLSRTIAKLNYLINQLHFQPNLRNLYVLHNETIVKIDLSSGWQQNILDQHIFTEKIINFTLSNCGTYLYLANSNKITFINLRSENKIKNIQIPNGNYEVSCLNCNIKNNLIAISLNNTNKEGGFYIYTFNNKNKELLTNNKISSDKRSQLSSRSLPANNKNEFSNDILNEALKKLDKIIHKITLEKEVINAIENRIKEKELSSEKTSSVNVNKTYSVTSKKTSADGTFTVKKNDKLAAQNTFTIESNNSNNNNTDSDISEL